MSETQTLTPSPGVIKPDEAPPTYHLTRWFLLRGLGLVYLLAFGSYWGQADGLIGPNGILPANQFFESLAATPGAETASLFWDVPSLYWLAPDSESFLHSLFAIGMIAAGLLVLGLAPWFMTVICWACYLSLVITGQVFLSFQWDVLLLEAGLLAIAFAPWGLAPRLDTQRPVPIVVIWLFRWLVFRLMFASGLLKLASGDPTWWGLTALDYHYFTQPIPNAVAWYAHQLPAWFQAVCVVATLFIEIVVPFCIFATHRIRFIGFILMAELMIVIFCTGNFCFFNVLSIVLFISLLDDKQIHSICPRWFKGLMPKVAPTQDDAIDELEGWPTGLVVRNIFIVAPITVWVAVMSLVGMSDLATNSLNRLKHMSGTGGAGITNPVRGVPLIMSTYRQLYPFRSVNDYGLFVSMTTSRLEIEIEGSYDGKHYKPYVFKYKPGAVRRRPQQIAPLQPRLDWQMWFEAISADGDNRDTSTSTASGWFVNLMLRLLQGSDPVLDLFEDNPFKASPPRYVRAILYDYHMTDATERASTGAWWKRDYVRLYVEPIQLEERK